MPKFSHLHVHTQFSLLDGAASIPALYRKAAADGQPALAITDHGNMFGVFKFVAEAGKHKGEDGKPLVKPIVGCEFYVVADRTRKQFTREEKDQRFHQLMLAKNAAGYRNLSKLCSLGYIEGFYSKYPRIDKELITQYHEGLIATTCCLAASVPRTILRKGEAAGEAEFKWWLDLFGEDYYIELQRHGIPEQDRVNAVLLQWAAKYQVPIIASNDSHYVDQGDANAHDILLCINTGAKQSWKKEREEDLESDTAPKGEKRFAFHNEEFYFKTQAEMAATFHDLPEALDNTDLIVGKIEPLKLKQDILLPNFKVPEGFTDQDDYLRHLSYQGAIRRYLGDGNGGIDSLDPKIRERIDFELFTVKTMGFAGYFLIVQDFINHGREIGVFVGPGRGSAAGSVVAYCTGITNIDPIKYDLLFERFLNPDRKSMPDIDTDFDDEGRQKVIDYVVEKYGRQQVAQIVTYGSMAAKLSIRDVARVLDLPLADADRLAKLVPERLGVELDTVLNAPESDLKNGFDATEIDSIKQLRKIAAGDDLSAQVLREAEKLEGSVRGVGIHAAGIIIAPKDLKEIIPVCTSKDSDLLLTQYDGKVIEDAGVIKMDFLGLKTLTIIRDALRLIRQNHGLEIDIDAIPLDDAKTYALYQRAETNGTFQFESTGMQRYLRELKPDRFDDLIAMNALFRPGPMDNIPSYIKRKHGREKVSYDLPEMEEFLEETHGITVYQEQVMLLSQKLAGFSKGDADVLRKAMGKKDRAQLDRMKGRFMDGVAAHGLNTGICEKIWTDWEKFAQYAFNKSHSTCYAFVAYQTTWLKANHPAEYMAAVLTHSQGSIDKITFHMEECRRMGIPVLGPDVNESGFQFGVNAKGRIRFGLGAVKGVGESAAEAIISERTAKGPYASIHDVTRRVNLRSANRKALESLAYAGAFDSLGVERARLFFAMGADQPNNMERLTRYGQQVQDMARSSQVSMFGDVESGGSIPEPALPMADGWSALEQLHHEKEVIGFYLSGHPLDDHRFELKHLCNTTLDKLSDLKPLTNRELSFAGIVTKAEHRIAKSGKPYGTFSLEDHTGSYDFMLFSEDYLKFKVYLAQGTLLYVKARAAERTWGRDEGQLELKVMNIDVLSDAREKYVQKIHLAVDADKVNDELIERLSSTLRSSPGRSKVNFRLQSVGENLRVDAASGSVTVSVTNELVQALEALPEVSWSLS